MPTFAYPLPGRFGPAVPLEPFATIGGPRDVRRIPHPMAEQDGRSVATGASGTACIRYALSSSTTTIRDCEKSSAPGTSPSSAKHKTPAELRLNVARGATDSLGQILSHSVA